MMSGDDHLDKETAVDLTPTGVTAKAKNRFVAASTGYAGMQSSWSILRWKDASVATAQRSREKKD
jgi:hypothetical protein